MGGVTTHKHIVLTPDDIARYEKHLVLHGSAVPPTDRVTEERMVDGAVLLQDQPPFTRLPLDCAFHAHHNGTDVFVVEHPPQVQCIRWKAMCQIPMHATVQRIDARVVPEHLRAARDALRARAQRWSGAEECALEVALPYVVLFFQFHGGTYHRCYCYFRTAPLVSPKDALCRAWLPNLAGSGMVCLDAANHFGWHPSARLSMVAQMALVEQRLWGSVWRGIWNCPHNIGDPWMWALETLVDPTFAYTLQADHGLTIRSLMELLLYAGGDVRDTHDYYDPRTDAPQHHDSFTVAVQRVHAAPKLGLLTRRRRKKLASA